MALYPSSSSPVGLMTLLAPPQITSAVLNDSLFRPPPMNAKDSAAAFS